MVALSDEKFGFARTLTQRQLYTWLFSSLICVLAAKVFGLGSLNQFHHALLTINYFVWGAVAVAAWRLWQFHSTDKICVSDVIMMGGVCVGLLIGALITGQSGLGLVFAIFGIFLLRFQRADDNLRGAGIVMLALTSNLTFAPLIFREFLDIILTADGAFVAFVLHFLRPDMVWTTATKIVSNGPTHFGILLVGGCSAFNGISAAVLVHLAWAMKHRTNLSRYDAIAIVATAAVIIVLNTFRLVLTAWSHDSYDFWHGIDGLSFGALIFSYTQTAIIIAGGFFSARWAAIRAS